MMPYVFNSQVSRDGTLSLALPPEVAGQNVFVTVIPASSALPMTQEEWRSWVSSMGGSWEGDFERMPQGDYEVREQLS